MRRPSRLRIALGLTSALVIFIVVAGTATASAWWSASTNVSSTATAASVGVTQSLAATPSLVTSYTSASLVAVGVVTVTNSSTRAATYTTSLTATSASTTLRAAVAVEVGTVSSCTTTATLSLPQTGTLATTVTYTGSLAAGASVALCVRTTMTAAGVAANSAATVTATASTAVLVGTWTATASPTLSFTQTVGGSTVITVDPDAWYFLKRSNGDLRCAESKDFGAISGTAVQTVDCNVLLANQLWRFTPATSGYYTILNKYSPTLHWNVTDDTTGQALIIATTTGSKSEWSVTGSSASTAIIALRSNTTLCASTESNNGNAKPMKIATCVAGNAEQAITLAMLGVANPAAITLTCAADGYNATYAWPQLTGYENEVTYRVLVAGVVTTAYSRGTGFDTTIAFASTAALAALGTGTKTVEVQQKLASGVWHRVGTGSLKLSNTTPYLACGA